MNQICSSINFYLNLIAVIIVFPALDFPADDGAIGKSQDSFVIAECRVDDLAIAAGNTEIQKKAEKQIAKINEKLKF